MEKELIIVAGGQGKRMYSEIPKQFLNVAGRPILFHTIDCFRNYPEDIRITLVLPEPFMDFWKSLCKRFDYYPEHTLVEGGESRFYSVKNGLKNIKGRCLIAIHDGVRPLVAKDTLNRVFKKAEETGNAVPIMKINESLRKLENDDCFPVDRRAYRLVQTPQCFHSDIITKAYQQEYQEHFTDDASVVESLGVKINLVDGNAENIKITRPSDMKIAEAFLK
ncbi:MAG: 2-C-methyl-D-erythritol 4-phosphate cytidylyltransferase [Bacteroidales bacterium]|nr:2-C-methyl-D-erythritol 4-phosphate cytidylyltransferase [Bacteroidales bacterium]